jgi:hypothetical protein
MAKINISLTEAQVNGVLTALQYIHLHPEASSDSFRSTHQAKACRQGEHALKEALERLNSKRKYRKRSKLAKIIGLENLKDHDAVFAGTHTDKFPGSALTQIINNWIVGE